MKHQPFESWLINDDPLTSEQTQSLDEHLKVCEQCQQLQIARINVEALFRDTPSVDPAPGFALRWQARLKREHQLELATRHRWQSWITLILIANAVSLFAILLGMQFFNTFDSITELLLVWVYRLTSLLTIINLFQNFLAILIRTLPGLLSPGGWALLAAIISSGSILWGLSMARLARLPRRA
jgi:hypothetical protein